MASGSPQENNFPKIGVQEGSIPDALTETVQEDEGSWWQSRTKSIPGPNTPDPSTKKWKSATSEEIERFRHVPVVGRFPWRIQYVVATLLLLVSLLALLWMTSSLLDVPAADDAGAIRQGVYIAEDGVAKGLRGQAVDMEKQKRIIAEAITASNKSRGSAGALGKDFFAPLAQLDAYQQDARNVVVAAQQVYAITSETLTQVSQPWRAAGQSGEWESVEAVNFAQILAELQYLQSVSQLISQGRSDVSVRFNTSRQNIEQSLRVFASSPAAAQNTNITQSYRMVAAAFTKMRPSLDTIQGRAQVWNNFLGLSEIIQAKKPELLAAIDTSAQSSTAPKVSRKSVWLAGTFIILSLLLLLLIGRKQQKWSMLHARSANEELQTGIEYMGEQLKRVADGDLSSRVRAGTAHFQPMSDALNSTIKRLRGLIGDVQQTARDASASIAHASDATGALVESSNESVSNFAQNVDDILGISATVQDVAEWSHQADSISSQTMDRVEAFQDSVQSATSHIQDIQEKSEEASSRAQRLQRSTQEIQSMAVFQNEISSQMEVLAIQAALQATKAGESGQGFRVVADALKTLSQKSVEGSRRVASLVEANLTDISGLESALLSIVEKIEEGVKMGEVSMENALLVRATLDQLVEIIDHIHTSSNEEANKASLLSQRTSEGLQSTERQKEKAQEAAESILSVIETVHRFDQSVGRFKV